VSFAQEGQLAPGFGQRFGSIDVLANIQGSFLASRPGAGQFLNWSLKFVKHIESFNCGFRSTGYSAALLLDLSFDPFSAATLFQLFHAPGALAHGLEYNGKHPTALPFPSDENYFIEEGLK